MKTVFLIVNRADFPDSPTCGIQETVDLLGSCGGSVAIPAGRYELRGAIRLPSRVSLKGEGEGTILTRPALRVMLLEADTEAVNAEAIGDKRNRCVLLVDTNTAPDLRKGDQIRVFDRKQVMSYAREVIVTSIHDGRIEGDCIYGDLERIYRTSDGAWAGNLFPALTSQDTEGVTIADLTIDGGAHPYSENYHGDFLSAGIHTFGAHRLRIHDVSVLRWPADGISVQGGSAIVTGCIVEGCIGSGLHPGTSLHRSVWANNMACGNRDGFFFCSTVRNTATAQNVLTNNRRHGVWGLGDPDMGNTVIGSICAENGAHGMEAGRAHGNAIVGNVCRANSQQGAGEHAAIMLHDHKNNVVVANVCFDNQEVPTQTVGIESKNPLGENVIAQNQEVCRNPQQNLPE